MALAPLRLDGVVPYPPEVARTYRERGYWTGQTHSGMLLETIDRAPDSVAVIDGNGAGHAPLTYAELGERVLRLAGGFSAAGLERGDRVVVHLPNIPEFIETVFALWHIGVLPVFALPAHRRTEIEYFIEFSGARGYVTADRIDQTDLVDMAEDLRRTVAHLDHVWIVGTGGDDRRDTFHRLRDHTAFDRVPRCLPEDPAFLQLSGGTTGRPKMIPRTHDDYLYSVRGSNEICAIAAGTVQLVVLPASHNFTMSSPGILGALMAGGTVVLAPNGSPDVAFPLIERHRVTQTQLVPPLALVWLNSGLKDRHDLSSLQVLQVGGAKFSEEAARRVRPELGVQLQQVFGMAEGLVNYTRLDDDENRISSTQGLRISPDDEVRVVDDDDTDLGTGVPGNLLVRGPYTIRGYFRAPEVNRKNFTGDGFYRTGDVVVMDELGYLTVKGRSKDQINRGGEKISPEEVENLLLAHGGIHDASVVGIPDEALGERSKVYIIRRDGADETELGVLGVKRFLRDRGLAAFKIPDVVEFVTEFPHTAVGKISKRDQRT
ncbi:(2,3-dihydroxybenzoyl)adenylate synthase [Corynebacterium neomassiliense]|uniref:(2,3-dihydroxybenzoyl)adenylate synthase n=1 Tax=Corynebacterium neomassiliense TaxID=2079482 RepID=UPI0010324687|nr:AMP-binding protein [Corynebacterium neomassiliense]